MPRILYVLAWLGAVLYKRTGVVNGLDPPGLSLLVATQFGLGGVHPFLFGLHAGPMSVT